MLPSMTRNQEESSDNEAGFRVLSGAFPAVALS
jgi:hypothetical protein